MENQLRSTILIVDPDPARREPLATFLRRRGYSVDVASCEQQLVSGIPQITHLIVSASLPEFGKDSIADQVRNSSPDVKVALVCRAKPADLFAAAMRDEADVLLGAPLNFDDVVSWLEETTPLF